MNRPTSWSEVATVWDFDARLDERDLPWLKAMLENNPIYVSPNVAREAVKVGFVEGVHFHIVRAIPVA